MRFLCCLLLALGPLYAQLQAGATIIDFGGGVVENPDAPVDSANTSKFYQKYLVSYVKYSWTISSVAGGGKTITYAASQCSYTVSYDVGINFFLGYRTGVTTCDSLSASAAELVGPIQAALAKFYSLASVYHYPPVDDSSAPVASPRITTLQPSAPADPQVILFDGIGLNLDRVDLTTFAIVNQVPIALGTPVNTFGIRPVTTGDSNEVWVASPGTTGITIADLAEGSVVATIPTPALAAGDYPVNVVFANEGATALEAVAYAKPDSSGNKGAILVFDAAGRTLTSTLPLPNAPQELLVAEDGLTAYSLGGNATITYYDVLSGTADLTAPFTFFTAGNGGVFIHPDGTRLFCVGCGDDSLDVFDLTTRQFTNFFNFNLAMYAAPMSANMSQDGSVIAITDNLYNVYMVDTRYGNLLTTYTNTSSSMVFPGAPIN